MARRLRNLWIMLLPATLALSPVAAGAEVSVHIGIVAPPPPTIVLPAPPPLVVVPGVPAVSYAPALQVDLFLHGQRWFYAHGGYWYAGPTYSGPWTPVAVTALPRAILAVPAPYYKVPPGHLKHRGGPPGHARGRWKGRD